jgi:hypothetical protein
MTARNFRLRAMAWFLGLAMVGVWVLLFLMAAVPLLLWVTGV